MPLEITCVREGVHLVRDDASPVDAELVSDLARRLLATGRPQVVVRPVTDTVKVLRDDVVGETVDRNTLWRLVGPAVLPEAVEVPGTWSELVAGLSAPELVEAVPPPAPRLQGT